MPGVGPKTALRIVEAAPLELLKNAILEGDITYFTRVKGLGKKNAQKIILELKNVLVETNTSNPSNQSLYDALRALRFTSQEIDQALKGLDLSGLSDQESLKLVLQTGGR